MKAPLQALLIAPDQGMREAILDGRKIVTIREGHRDYKVGSPVMLCCQIEPWCVMADVVYVRHCLVRNLSKMELAADGFSSKRQMISEMLRFYPIMSLESKITFIRWANVRGKLVDEHRAR